MKALILTASLVAVLQAQAAEQKTTSFHCAFTEPFFSLDIDLEKKTITKISPVISDHAQDGEMKTELVAKNISVRRYHSDPFKPAFQVLARGRVLAKIVFDAKGTDHMSRFVYPYSIVFEGKHPGGCESNLVKRFDPGEGEAGEH